MSHETRPRRIRRKPDVAEREILDAAARFLETNEFRDLTVDAVMQGTGMRRSAFYNYFNGRSGLVLRLVAQIEDEMLAASRLWFDDTDDSITSLELALDASIDVWARNGHVLRALHAASYHDDDVLQYYRHGLVQTFIDAVAKKLRAERRAERSSVPNPKDVAHALIMMNIGVLSEEMGRPAGQEPGRGPPDAPVRVAARDLRAGPRRSREREGRPVATARRQPYFPRWPDQPGTG